MVDGHTRKLEANDLQVGLVIRMINSDGSSFPFADCRVNNKNPLDEDMWEIVRPTPYGHESIIISENDLSGFLVVLNSRGEPYIHGIRG